MSPKKSPPMPWLKPAVQVGALIPLALMPVRASMRQLGANPIAEALNELGLLALVMLIASLACTPAKTLFGWTWPARIRRSLGVIAFVYAFTHFVAYAGFDQGLALGAILADIAKRKFIFVGFAALVLMTPLVITSTDRMVRRLGFNRWKGLHRLAYVCGILGAIHFILRVKKDRTEPLIYAALLAFLLGVRAFEAARAHAKKSRPRLSPGA